MLRFLAVLVLAVLVLGGSSALQASAPDGSIQDFIDSEMPASGVPGLAYAVVDVEGIASVGARGVARLGGDTAITPETPFVSGSISKSFTALAVMQLVEAGEVDLDGQVGVAQPDEPGPADAMTTTRTSRSIDIDRRIEDVFAFITDPEAFMTALPPDHRAVVSDVRKDPDGIITDFRLTETSRLGPLHLDSRVDVTVEEYVPYQRYVEKDSTGLLQTVTLEGPGDATRLTLDLEISSPIPLLDRAAVFLTTAGRGMGRGLDIILAAVKEALEAQTPGDR